MATYAPKEEKYYDFNGHVVFNYTKNRNSIVKVLNTIGFVFGKPLPKTRVQEKIANLQYKEVKDKLDKLPKEEKDKINILMKQFYIKKFELENQLQEEMLFPVIDKYIGFDKVLEEMQK